MGLSPSPMELVFLAVLALIILGPNKLPEAARSIGKGVREMRESFQGGAEDHEEDDRFRIEDHVEHEPDPVVAQKQEPPMQTGSAPQPPPASSDHQKDAESSVPSASSSSTDRV